VDRQRSIRVSSSASRFRERSLTRKLSLLLYFQRTLRPKFPRRRKCIVTQMIESRERRKHAHNWRRSVRLARRTALPDLSIAVEGNNSRKSELRESAISRSIFTRGTAACSNEKKTSMPTKNDRGIDAGQTRSRLSVNYCCEKQYTRARACVCVCLVAALVVAWPCASRAANIVYKVRICAQRLRHV